MNAMLAVARWSTWELSAKRLTRHERVGSRRPYGYELREGAEDFLQAHPELRSFLNEAEEKLREVFGAESELAIEKFEDPESPSSEARLFLLVRTSLDAAAAQALLDQFDEQWWLDNAPRADHLIQVSLEFV